MKFLSILFASAVSLAAAESKPNAKAPLALKKGQAGAKE
jgi:hypothetical protein